MPQDDHRPPAAPPAAAPPPAPKTAVGKALLRLSPKVAHFLRVFFRCEATVAIIAYCVVAGTLIFDVFSRELTGNSIWGAQKFAVFASVITGFCGIGIATATGRHLRPRFADNWLPKAWEPAVIRIGDALSGTIFAALGCVAIVFVAESYEYGDIAATLDWPLWIPQIVVPYGFFSAATRFFIFAIWPELRPSDTGIPA